MTDSQTKKALDTVLKPLPQIEELTDQTPVKIVLEAKKTSSKLKIMTHLLNTHESLRPMEIAKEFGWPASSVRRMLGELKKKDFCSKNEKTGKYFVTVVHMINWNNYQLGKVVNPDESL